MPRRRRKIDASRMEVMKTACATCPFEGAHPVHLRLDALAEYTESIVTYQSQHLCHTADNKKLCRGGRNLMLRVMHVQGLIDEPTDEAFDRKRIEVLGK